MGKTWSKLPIPATLSQAMCMAKWAILGPTPGSCTSSSTVLGMSPPYFCFRMAVVCLMYFTLFWKTKGKGTQGKFQHREKTHRPENQPFLSVCYR